MTRASDAARNTSTPSGEADRKASNGAKNGSAKPMAASSNGGSGSGSAGPKPPAGPQPGPLAGTGSKSSGTGGPAKSTSGPAGPPPSRPAGSVAPPSAPQTSPPPPPPPRMRPPLPGPPPGMRMPGPPMPGGFRYVPPPPPRRRLDGAQRGRLFGIAVALILVGAAFGYLVSLAVPTRYGAITTIMYNVAGENTGDFLKTDRDITTQTVLLTSRNVLQPVADQNGVDVDDLTKDTTATVLSQSNVIQVEVKDQTPDGAVNMANAIAKQYITVSNASSPKGYVQNQLAAVQKQLAGPPAAGSTPANTVALQARAAALQNQLDQMNLTSNQSTVLVPAYPLAQPVSPSGGGSALTGMICGLLIAVITVITLSRRWTRS